MEQNKINSSDVHFVNVSYDLIDGFQSNDNFSTKSLDPLQGLDSELETKFYRVDSVVFAEPLQNISNGNNSPRKVTSSTHDKIIVIDNVTVQQRIDKKYKRYHINIEDPSSLTCIQSNCNRKFSTIKLLKAHIRKVHCADRSRFICDICGDTFACQYLLRRHSAVHDGRTVQCPVCDVVLRQRTDLSAHLRTHSGSKPHGCTVCRKTFLRKSTLDNHIKFVHRSSQLKCTKCQDRFETRSQWSRHMSTHRKNK